jgi:hypothetical protein
LSSDGGGVRSNDARAARRERSVHLLLDEFASNAIDEAAALEGLTPEEFISFAVLYYLADLDSGRISREVSKSPFREKRR